MELADRGTLRDWERDGRLGALSWAGRKLLCRNLCAGMEFLHDVAGVVHRDLKPENVLFKSEATRGGRRDTLKARPRPLHCAPLVLLRCSLPDWTPWAAEVYNGRVLALRSATDRAVALS